MLSTSRGQLPASVMDDWRSSDGAWVTLQLRVLHASDAGRDPGIRLPPVAAELEGERQGIHRWRARLAGERPNHNVLPREALAPLAPGALVGRA